MVRPYLTRRFAIKPQRLLREIRREGLSLLAGGARRLVPCYSLIAELKSAAHSHHSISGMYDSRRDVRKEGVVTQFEFINPHAFITLEVRETGRASQQWRVELDDRGELSAIGMTAQTLRPGDQVIVVGSPARREAESPGPSLVSIAPPTVTASNRCVAGRGCDRRDDRSRPRAESSAHLPPGTSPHRAPSDPSSIISMTSHHRRRDRSIYTADTATRAAPGARTRLVADASRHIGRRRY